ncbi:hypothetical protein G6L29_31070 [Agrobacterium rhizogenes]|uniref:Uncharacterized protein n=1 Tax=Rhizobium rhizogenes NBRC 13257 TaxID=1220581 RepID=A0AA87QGU7_RHIRH|nr:hypothetical protein [Rhizobium rhizogenes]NTG65091.1 hypothetical protein [Rhizobium rhizogenes]NTG71542.1 hypothetical protein [Rhizobium rhizogenes]NTG84441.1 hypothetical protein [Rhizobium rhizogenes]NTG90835.1 hypothetical protein [Rhizobium rhizogenes]NTH29469.1 hypothetical protein [Rhizobium rhizogenes]
MLGLILLKTVFFPLGTGLALGLLLLKKPQAQTVSICLVLPALIVATYCFLEGFPSFPPVAAKEKLPLLIIAGSAIFAIAASRLSGHRTWLFLCLCTIALLDILFLGQRVLFTNPSRVGLAIAVSVIVLLSSAAAARKIAQAGMVAHLAYPTAAFAAMISSALVAAFSAFVGMAQANGAVAALIGGVNIVFVLAGKRREDGLYDLGYASTLAFALALIPHFAMTALFAPKVPVAGLLLSAACFVTPVLASYFAKPVLRLPHALAIIALGLLALVPAAGAAAVSSFSYSQ